MPLRRPGRIAAGMLFVWLLGAFASWTHACLVEPAGRPDHVPGHHRPADVVLAEGDARVVAAGLAHDSDPAHEPCVDFCDAGQRVVPKPQPPNGEGAANPTPFPPVALAGWPVIASGRLDPTWRALDVPRAPGPPAAIAFLRLTL